MSDTVIRVENLGKKYILGEQKQGGNTTLRDKLTDGAKSLSRRLLRSSENRITNSNSSEFWALKDVSFEIKQSERVGIIGRNGAGKSTLLKVLSRITEPTRGKVALKGRVASLLEVGTGFHQELTGRENIYLNGAVLGMSKAEIKRRFDEIVDFSGVEKFLDTPVKRYSSGMYVRLAFAVAAHLEPEVLIVDEVLAVGDAEFQKKCLGKMKDVGKDGKTVLFVSHNMAAIRVLCSRAILMKNGHLLTDTDVDNAVSEYLSEDEASDAIIVWDRENAPQSPEICFTKAYILNSKGEYASSLDCRTGFSIVAEYQVLKPLNRLRIGFFMQNLEGVPMCGSNDTGAWSRATITPGHYISKCDFPGYTLNAGMYSVNFGADTFPYTTSLLTTPYCLSFTIEDVDGHGPMCEKPPGVLRPKLDWNLQQLFER